MGNIELIELFLFSWIAFAVCASAIFTEYDIKYYYILLSKILFLYSLLLLFSSLPRLKVFLINLLFIVFALCAMHIVIGFIYINFFESNETTQVERRQEHIENHIKEAEKLDEIIRVLEKINRNLDEGKN